jgi:hypothetical protein
MDTGQQRPCPQAGVRTELTCRPPRRVLFSVCIDRFANAAAPTNVTVATMKSRQLLRNFVGQAYWLGFAAALAACSGSDGDAPGASGSGGSAANDSGGSTSAGSGATTTVSGSPNSGGSSSGPKEVVGSFQVQVVADEEDPSAGATSVIGKVNDAPSPAAVIWTVTKQEGACRVEVPSVPFCDGGCGTEVCVADGVCQAYPAGHSVGEVTLTGVNVAAGGSELMLKEIAKAYQPPAGTSFAYPPFAEGDAIAVHATGGDYAAFDLSAKGVAPLTFTSTDFELETGKELALTWQAAADPQSLHVHVKLDISHHGGSRGMIECDGDDSGSLTISAALMTELIALGVAGFPSVIMTRASTGSAQLSVGRVELVVSSKVERLVTVAGVDSCTEDTDCPDGKVCQSDLTCM